MARTNVMQYNLTLYINGNVIAGLTTTGLKVKPTFDQALLKENAGTRSRTFSEADIEIPFSGETIERDSTEVNTHDDFQTLRSLAKAGTAVNFVYGRMTVGEKVWSGSGVISDYSEDAGSEKKRATFSGTIAAFAEDVTEETWATTTAGATTTE